MTRQHRQQRGTILIGVLTCLLIVSGLAVAMVKSALTARKAVRSELQQAQTQFLLEAGIQRAVDKLSRDTDYQGEIWELPAEALESVRNPPPQPLTQNHSGEGDSNRSILASIEIQVTTSDEGPFQVTVVAQLPADSPLSIRRSHTFTFSNEE
jgi:type II secretory pathway pseudopilin PulG